MSTVIRVLVVDDSAFVRKVVREMLSRNPYIDVVGAARDGVEALEMVQVLKPDLVTCDLLMPGMDGVSFVKEQMARKPVPILVLTATPEDGEKALEAIESGAVDILQKPTSLANDQILAIREELIEKVKAASRTRTRNLSAPCFPPETAKSVAVSKIEKKIVVIGISTGGPQALRYLIPQIPADFPVPVAIVLHMPVGYTRLFAEKLNELSRLEVIEAKDGDPVEPGIVLIAPAGRHLLLRRTPGERVVAQLSVNPIDLLHRPAADVLFQSAAECYGSKVLGVVMTGMGDDGKMGAGWIKAQGGTVLTEAEESCVIYGMPRSVVEAGLSDGSATLDQMLKKIIQEL